MTALSLSAQDRARGALLVGWLREEYLRGRRLAPHNDEIAQVLSVGQVPPLSVTMATHAVAAAEAEGLVVVLRPNVRRRGFAAPDGSWVLAAPRVGGPRRAEMVPQAFTKVRNCNRCRGVFQALSPTQFACVPCGRQQQRDAVGAVAE